MKDSLDILSTISEISKLSSNKKSNTNFCNLDNSKINLHEIRASSISCLFTVG